MNLSIFGNILSQLRDPNKKTWILLSPSSLGETLCLCSLCESFIKKHGYAITLVIPKSHEFITLCYPNLFYKIYFMPVMDMRLLSSLNLVPKNFFELDFPINTWTNQINDTNSHSLYELYIATEGKKGIDFTDLYRFNLRLDWNSPIRLPTLPNDEFDLVYDNLQKNIKLNNGFVLLLLGNNTNKQIPSAYLNQLCIEYQKLGIVVVVNSFGATFKTEINHLSNIKFLDLTVPEVASLARHALSIVGGCNGLMVLLASLDLSKKIHLFLPNFILEDPEKLLFRACRPNEGSITLNFSEIISHSNTIFEYPIEEDPSEIQIKDIVSAIINS